MIQQCKPPGGISCKPAWCAIFLTDSGNPRILRPIPDICWGKHTCHMGVVKALKALSAIPEDIRTDEINDTIQKASEFLLVHHIHKRSHDLRRVSKPGWLKFGFPLMYQTDVLEILDILTAPGYFDCPWYRRQAHGRSHEYCPGQAGRHG